MNPTTSITQAEGDPMIPSTCTSQGGGEGNPVHPSTSTPQVGGNNPDEPNHLQKGGGTQ